MDIWEFLGALQHSPALVLVFVCCALLSYATLGYYRRASANPSPPGPWRIPLLGSTVFFTKFPPLAVTKLSQEYGDVMTLSVGNQTWVVLSSADVVQEALRKNSDVTSGRPRREYLEIITENGYGIVHSDTIMQRIHKTFLISTLKNFGVGRDVIEERIRDEIVKFIENAQENKGKAIDPTKAICKRVLGIIGGMMFGSHFDSDYSESMLFMKNILYVFEIFTLGILGDIFPLLRYLPGDLCKHGARFKMQKYFTSYIGIQIQLHRNDNLDPEDEPRDYIGAYLQKAAELGKKTDEHTFSDKQLSHTIRHVNGAALETTTNLLRFCLVYLLHFPELQQKIFDELLEVFPGDSLITARQRKLCPIIESFILECQRKGTVGPFGMHHRTREEVTIGGYRLPKNTTLVPNFWAMHHDPRVWKNPEDFDPNRFLDENGKLDPKTAILFPFSIGRRSCPGEAMAKVEMFLFIASIVKHFKLELPPGDPLPPTLGKFGLVVGPHPFRLKFMPRD